MKYIYEVEYEAMDLQSYNPLEFYQIYSVIYDQMSRLLDYYGWDMFEDFFPGLKLDKDLNILDIAAGTGHLGRVMRKAGYKNIDALEPNSEMFQFAENLYRRHYDILIEKDTCINVKREYYDMITAFGCLYPYGYVPFTAIFEMLNVIKPGGLLMFDAFRRDKKIVDRLLDYYSNYRSFKHIRGFPKFGIQPHYNHSLVYLIQKIT